MIKEKYKNLEQYFPTAFKPNVAQRLILSEISRAIELGKKFIIVNAPTATGKSFISKTLSNASDECTEKFRIAANTGLIFSPNEDKIRDFFDSEGIHPFGTAILTVTKTLQDQYENLFPDGKVLKGKANYTCAIDSMHGCDNGVCEFNEKQLKDCKSHSRCPYINQRALCVPNKCAFYTYAMYSTLPKLARKRQFLVCDEASEVEDEIVNRYTFELVFKTFKKYDIIIPPTPKENASDTEKFDWASKVEAMVLGHYLAAFDDIKATMKAKKRIVKKQKERLFGLKALVEMMGRLVSAWKKTEYLVEHTAESLRFVPYNVDTLAQELFEDSEIVILMSATIVNHKKFAQTLGIKDYYYIEAETTLDPKKAPIYCNKKYYLNQNSKHTILPKMIEVALKLCDMHKNEKGIIHTHSMDILQNIKNRVGFSNDRFLFREQGLTNESIMQIHQSTDEPTILVSPSMTHGIDLKGDLGRFQIIMKAPYSPLGDQRIKRKFIEDPEWYLDRMLSTLIQMSGRCNRIASDESVTYILDATVVKAISENGDKLPRYFKERFI